MLSKRSLSFCFVGIFLLVQTQLSQAEKLSCPVCPFTTQNEEVLLNHVNAHFEHDVEVEQPPANNQGDKKASDIDNKRTLTKSVIPLLKSAFGDAPEGTNRILVDTDVDHYAYSNFDSGWGCGYRNLQMILSAIFQIDKYYQAICDSWNSYNLNRESMASILELQIMIETAWMQGFDQEGGKIFKYRLVDTKEWLGATEIVTVLTSLGIETELIDFHRPTAEDGIHHPDLFNWVLQYFLDSEEKLPLFLQREGHSQTIIGVEQTDDGVTLLVLDPYQTARQFKSLDGSDESFKLIRRNLEDLDFDQYQIIAIKDVFKNEDAKMANKIVKSTRIPNE